MIATVSDIIKKAIKECQQNGAIKTEELPDIIIEKPKRDDFGDFATNIAMLLSSKEGKQPRQIAELLAKEIRQSENIKKVDVAGPGFINIFMGDNYWLNLLKEIYHLKGKYGASDIGAGKKVQVEFVSANPTGPIHIGHGRGAAVGDTLANILDAAGFEVIREYYINDRGRQIFILGQSVFLCYLRLLGRNVAFPEDFYKGEYIKDIAEEFLTKHGDKYKNVQLGFPECLHEFIDFSMRTILSWIERDIKDFGVDFDVWYSEKTLFDRK